MVPGVGTTPPVVPAAGKILISDPVTRLMLDRLLLVSGSLRRRSTNTSVLRTLRDLAPFGLTYVLYERLGDLPHFNPDLDGQPLHPVVADLRTQIHHAAAIVFSTPEYAGALPGIVQEPLGLDDRRRPSALDSSEARRVDQRLTTRSRRRLRLLTKRLALCERGACRERMHRDFGHRLDDQRGWPCFRSSGSRGTRSAGIEPGQPSCTKRPRVWLDLTLGSSWLESAGVAYWG